MPACPNLLIALNTMICVVSSCLNRWCVSWFGTASNELLTDYSGKELLEAIEENPYENIALVVDKTIRRSLLSTVQFYSHKKFKQMLRKDCLSIHDSLRKNTISFIGHRDNCSSTRLTTCHRQKDSGSVFIVNTIFPLLSTARLFSFSLFFLIKLSDFCINRQLTLFRLISVGQILAGLFSPRLFILPINSALRWSIAEITPPIEEAI